MAKFSAKYSDRVNAVKRIWVDTRTQCSHCKKFFSKEWSFQVLRWDSGMMTKTYIYCTDCASSPEEVVHIIDTDKTNFGLAFVDNFLDYEKISKKENNKFVLNLLKGLIKNPKI